MYRQRPVTNREIASASVAPAMPPPTMITSLLSRSCHQRFDFFRLFHHVAVRFSLPVSVITMSSSIRMRYRDIVLAHPHPARYTDQALGQYHPRFQNARAILTINANAWTSSPNQWLRPCIKKGRWASERSVHQHHLSECRVLPGRYHDAHHFTGDFLHGSSRTIQGKLVSRDSSTMS